MTLFANSGVAWPRHEKETKEAGKKSLEAASQIFRILADMESRSESDQVSQFDLNQSAEHLELAGKTYQRVAESLSGETTPRLTGSELELAGVNGQWRRFVDEDLYDLRFPYRGQIPIGELYRDLSHRLARLANAVRHLNVRGETFDVAPQVFHILRQWELISTLSRIIATLGRRSAQVGE